MEIKQGNLKPDLDVNLNMTDPDDPTGETLIPIPSLDTVTSITMDMRSKETGELVIQNSPCQLVDVATARVVHQWIAGETDHPVGKYDVEFDVLWPGARPQTVPSKKFYKVEITETLD